jgi:hypothetical protein
MGSPRPNIKFPATLEMAAGRKIVFDAAPEDVSYFTKLLKKGVTKFVNESTPVLPDSGSNMGSGDGGEDKGKDATGPVPGS